MYCRIYILERVVDVDNFGDFVIEGFFGQRGRFVYGAFVVVRFLGGVVNIYMVVFEIEGLSFY